MASAHTVSAQGLFEAADKSDSIQPVPLPPQCFTTMQFDSSVVPRRFQAFLTLPERSDFVLARCRAPLCCLCADTVANKSAFQEDADCLVECDIAVRDGRIASVSRPSDWPQDVVVHCAGAIAFPAFVDLHTHIGVAARSVSTRNAALFSIMCIQIDRKGPKPL
jgi:hypothetical protein